MKTKNVHYRVSEDEYKTVEEYAKRVGTGVSAVASKTMRMFAQVEARTDFWKTLRERAEKDGVEEWIVLVNLMEKQ